MNGGEGCEWIQTIAPTSEPLSLAEAKLQARIAIDDEDSLLNSYIIAAREAAEGHLGRGLLTQTWKLTLPAFAETIWLPMAAPLQSVTSVKYYDTTGTLTTLAGTVYTVDTTSRPGKIMRAVNQSWPALQGGRLGGLVEITYIVGWTAKDLIPERIKQGMRLYVTAVDADRDKPDTTAAEACWTDRVFWKPPVCVAYR